MAGVEPARRAARNLPDDVSLVELRLDALDSAALASGEWLALPRDSSLEWTATWRSPEEGGHSGPCPPGILRQALEGGYRWVDVEARRLEAQDPEVRALPPDRRWVSAHPAQPPASPTDLRRAWDAVSRHPAALHKLVVPADRFLVNTWIRELDRELGPEGAGERCLFAQGWIGHPSRILGCLAGQGVMFLAGREDAPTADGQPSLDRAFRVYRLGESRPDILLYGVLGRPARHSRSPEIHNLAFQRTGHPGLYIALESEAVDPVVAWVREGRLAGASVTAPFKIEAAAQVDMLEEKARRIGSVNTIWRREGRLWGANTDFEAAREILAELDLTPGDPVAVLGSGGAARAVLAALEDLGLAATVYNRNPLRGRATAGAFAAEWGGPIDGLQASRYRVVVNATPLGSSIPLPLPVAAGIRRETAVVDLGYGMESSAWERSARAEGCSFRGGLEFLARQAAGQQERWTGERPPWDVLAEALRAGTEGAGR